MTNKFKTLLKTTAAIATLMAGSQTWGAQWTDVTDSSTIATAGTFTLTDKHVYRPSNAAAFAGTVSLPDKAEAVIGASSVATFLGNTFTKLKILGGGSLSLYGSDGVADVITALEKTGKGAFVLNDHSSSGITITAATVTAPAAFKDIRINTYGAGTTLTFTAGATETGWADSTLYVDALAKVTVATLTSCPVLLGEGTITLPAGMVTLPFSKIKGFKGKIVSGGAVTIDYTK